MLLLHYEQSRRQALISTPSHLFYGFRICLKFEKRIPKRPSELGELPKNRKTLEHSCHYHRSIKALTSVFQQHMSKLCKYPHICNSVDIQYWSIPWLWCFAAEGCSLQDTCSLLCCCAAFWMRSIRSFTLLHFQGTWCFQLTRDTAKKKQATQILWDLWNILVTYFKYIKPHSSKQYS